MAKNNTYKETTTTVPVENTSYDNIIFKPTKPVLDSELNFISDLQSSKVQDLIRSKAPSGWLDANFKKGQDDSGNSYGVNSTLTPNTFILNSMKQTPMIANVNGWILHVGGSFTTEDNKVKIEMPLPPSSGSRTDLVFLEVFKAQISAQSAQNKPDLDKIYKYGNENYGGDNLEDDIVNEVVNAETTERVQIQYRIRVIPGVDFDSYPEGLEDSNTVRGQGAKEFPVPTYNYRNAGDQWDDYGLYVTGNGTSADKLNLGTVDGYCYAIPMFKIHRKNTGSFSNSNQNGAAFSLLSGSFSDRPDGLYNDQIDLQDIEDLRHLVSLDNFNYQELLDKSLEDLYSGELNTVLFESKLDSNLRKSNKGLYIDRISNTTAANVELITRPNNQQRYFSDVPATIKNGTKKTISEKSAGTSGTDWSQNDEFNLSVATFFGNADAVLGTSNPKVVYLETPSGPVNTVSGTWVGLGTTVATFTLDSNPSLTNQDLYITYDLDYAQKGDSLKQPVKDIIKVDDERRSEQWGIISVNDFDTSVTSNQRRRIQLIEPREVSAGHPDYAYTYRLDDPFINEGMGTIYSYHINADGSTLNYVIPASLINAEDVAYVYACYNVDTGDYVGLTGSQRNIDGSLTITLPSALSALLRFDVALSGGILQYDERTQSIVELGRVQKYTLNGNGSNIIYTKNTLSGDSEDLVLGVQKEFREVSLGVFNPVTACYINGIRNYVDITIEPETSLVKLEFAINISTTQEVEVFLLQQLTPKTADSLNIFYDYYTYQGITSKNNFGNTSSSYINSKVLYHRNKLDIVTNGTGAVNSSEYLPKKFEPLLGKLPRVNGVNTGDFTGTVHETKEIIGGSYTLNSDFNSPYASGEKNYLSKEGVMQAYGSNKGGMFASSAGEGHSGIHKLVVAGLLEVVEDDGSGNFVKGELALKVETNYFNNNIQNRITNSDSGEANNSFDSFKIEGRPLIKLNSK